MDAYTLSCESFIYIEGEINEPPDKGTGVFNFINNGLAFLSWFDQAYCGHWMLQTYYKNLNFEI